MHPDLADLIEVCVRQAVGHVVLAGGLPPRAAIEQLKNSGAKVICFAPSAALARRLVRSGADALVIEGAEAGGHIGPVSTSVLAQEILPQMLDVPVFVAGGIGRGEAIVSYLEMGASGCQIGTRLVCATESIAHPEFKKAFIRANARDAVPTVQLDPRFPVIPVRAIGREFFHFDAASQTREVVLSSAAPLAPGLAGELRWQAGRPHLPPEFLQTREGRLGAFVVEQGQPVFRAVDGAQAGRPAAVDWAVDTPVVDGGRLGIGLEGSRPR